MTFDMEAEDTPVRWAPRVSRDEIRLLYQQDATGLIDALLHAFHQSAKKPFPHRAAAHNVVEGSHQQVLGLLESLAYGDISTPGTRDVRAAWKTRYERMRSSWQGGEHARSHPRDKRSAR